MAKKTMTPDERKKIVEILRAIRDEVHALRIQLEQRRA